MRNGQELGFARVEEAAVRRNCRGWRGRDGWFPVRLLCGVYVVWVLGFPVLRSGADVIRLKDGTTLTGLVDKDGTLVQIFDHEGLRRVVLRDSKIEEIVSEPPPKAERFRLVQPLAVHAGEMPPFAINVEAGPWDGLGRRTFRYVGTKSGKATSMTQAINELGPYAVRYRGVDGFWQGSLPLSQIPKPVVLGLLAKFDPAEDRDERLRLGRFLIQAEYFEEAKLELDDLERDFPELEETVAGVRALVLEAESRVFWKEIERRRAARQPREVERRLRAFPKSGAAADVAAEVRNLQLILEARAQEDRVLAQALQQAADALPREERVQAESLLLEIFKALAEAPDAVRERLEPFRKSDAGILPGRRVALALSGYLCGAEQAVDHLPTAVALGTARGLMRDYLASTSNPVRLERLAALEALALEVNARAGGIPAPPPPVPVGGTPPAEPGPPADPPAVVGLPRLNALVRHMTPPLHDDRTTVPQQVRLVRVHDDPYPDQPSEYAVWLPPEYHPLRTYPALVVLHGPEAPEQTLGDWIEEAARRGYILVAPEYFTGGGRAYRYTSDEHASVLLVLRDALKRYAIDSNRVFLTGMLEGGNMAWDFGLAHPDLFAGVAVISGLPAKYVWAYRSNLELLPMYIAMGDLAPAENEVVFEQWAKPLISRNHDLVYVKYFKRGLERLPEEVPAVFNWAANRVRVTAPKQFVASAGREGDDRFYGLVIRGFAERRSVRPEAADPLGKNLKPAELQARANALLNKWTVEASGVTGLDVWVGPDTLDLSKRLEVQVNGRSVYRGQIRLDQFAAFLEDLRIRGDRWQSYWMKVSVNLGAARVGRAGS